MRLNVRPCPHAVEVVSELVTVLCARVFELGTSEFDVGVLAGDDVNDRDIGMLGGAQSLLRFYGLLQNLLTRTALFVGGKSLQADPAF